MACSERVPHRGAPACDGAIPFPAALRAHPTKLHPTNPAQAARGPETPSARAIVRAGRLARACLPAPGHAARRQSTTNVITDVVRRHGLRIVCRRGGCAMAPPKTHDVEHRLHDEGKDTLLCH